jgi:ectoine hydroxylase-related dioxygenase (phytanoyl-CoA dioxygenase family)
MMSVGLLTDSTSLIGNAEALRRRYDEDGALYLRGVVDPELIGWAHQKYRGVLAAEELIDPANEAPVWTGKPTSKWRPCDALGTSVWHEIIKQPKLNAIMRDVFDADPVWIPIAAHRSALPTGPIKEDQDIFAGRHQDGFYNEGMLFTICWMPIRDVNIDRGSFAVAPGTHKRGSLHDTTLKNNAIPASSIPPEAWRTANFCVGDVLIFNYLTAHTALPNPSNEIRMSLDVRAIPAWAPQPVIGAVEKVDGDDVSIRTEHDELVTVHVTDDTLIRDMNPWPRIPKGELEKIAYPGAHVMAMARKDGTVTVLRRNFY